MDKKTRIYLFIFVLLLLVAGGYFLKSKMAHRATADQSFAEPDTNAIERVVITGINGTKVNLVRDGKQWLVNDTVIAMPTKMNFLLRTLASFKIVSGVDKDRIPQVISQQLNKPVKVEIYDDAKGKPSKVYYVGEALQTNVGNYAMLEVDGQPTGVPHIISITGAVADMQSRFFTGPEDWRDLKVFNYDIDEIKRVTILYPYHPASSFRLTAIGKDSASIEKMIKPTDVLPDDDKMALEMWTKKTPKLSKPRVADFLNSFKFINAEAFNSTYEGKDTIVSKTPLVHIYVDLENGVTDSITVFLMPANQRTKADFDQHGNPVKYDVDRYFALINHNKDFVVIQQYVFGKIFRQRNDFYIFN